MHFPRVPRIWCCCCCILLLQVQLMCIMTLSGGGGVAEASLPVVKIGSLLDMNSTTGKVAWNALQLALQDVNANQYILPNHELVLDTLDSVCDAFQGAASAVELLKEEVVAIAGPQTSKVAEFVAALGGATQVPVVSFSATSPSLTKANNPYFLRTVHNDAVGMQVMASLIQLFGWKEVAAISTNDDVGVESLDALSEALSQSDINLLGRKHIPGFADATYMLQVLNELALLEGRVFVVHLPPGLGRLFFSTALSLSMMTSGYVWLMSEAISNQLEDLPANDPIWASTQGVVAVRSYIPPSPELDAFKERLSTQLDSNASTIGLPMTIYGFYAYDTIWMIVRAIHTFLSSGQNFTFIARGPMAASAKGSNDLARLKILREGPSFVKIISDTHFEGISGRIQVDSNGDLVGASYEILNLIGKSHRVVGYWNKLWGFSQSPSSNLNSSMGTSSRSSMYSSVATRAKAVLDDIIWPGGASQIPRGWAVAKNGQKLQIGVPIKTGFPSFLSVQMNSNNVTTFHGFCIDVFETAISYLAYPLNYHYVPYGSGNTSPNYDELIRKVARKDLDAVVGDVAVTMERSKIVDFTQPYRASGLVVVVPTEPKQGTNAWAFMRPFSTRMWCTTLAFFLFTGLTIWALEHKMNKDFRGKPKEQVVTLLWFIFSTLFFAQREKTRSTLGRIVLIIWLFVILIIVSSYTANLTSILTVQQLTTSVQGITGLVSSNMKIGYQEGSFVEDYLLQMSVPSSRLVGLRDQTDYANAFSEKVIGAIVDELPYMQVFLSTECKYTICGQEFTKSGWGFAFPKGSELAVDFSTAILQMAENGRLQQIHDYWLNTEDCGPSSTAVANELGVDTFWGLFLVTGSASVLCVSLYCIRLIWQYCKTYREDRTKSDPSISGSVQWKTYFSSFVKYADKASNAEEMRNDAARRSCSQIAHRRSERDMEFGAKSARPDEPMVDPARPHD